MTADRDAEIKTLKALAALDEMAEQWATDVALVSIVAAIHDKDDRESRIEALARQAYVEGCYNALCAAKDGKVPSINEMLSEQASEIAALRRRVAQMGDALRRARLALPVLRTVLSKMSKDGMSLGVKASEETLADIEAALSPSPPAESALLAERRRAIEEAARLVESSLMGCVWGTDLLPLQERYAKAIRALSPSPPAEARSCRGTRHD